MQGIIQIQVGNCGNHTGIAYWDKLTREHDIDPTGAFAGDLDLQLEQINVCFQEHDKNRYTPRAVLVDLEPESIDCQMNHPLSRLFGPETLIRGKIGTGNNWAKGYYTEGADLIEQALDEIRKQAEACDRLQGFCIPHSLGGGTGSGLGSLLMTRIKQEYSNHQVLQTFSVFPSFDAPSIESYNALLSMIQLVDLADQVQVFDNEALYGICNQIYRMKTPLYLDFNHFISDIMAGTTCPYRFPCQLNSNMAEQISNLTPFPKIHFIMSSFSPLIAGISHYKGISISKITQQMLQPRNFLCSANPSQGKFLSGTAIYRGRISSQDVQKQILEINCKTSPRFIKWIDGHLKAAKCPFPHPGLKAASILLSNSTAIQGIFRKIIEHINLLLKKRTFLYRYTNEGMDEMEFIEAQANLANLVSEYECLQQQKFSIEEDDYDFVI